MLVITRMPATDSVHSKIPYQLDKKVFISEIVKESTRSVELLAEYGIFCVSCPLNQYDTLEAGAFIHGMSQEDMDTMIAEINEQLAKEARNG